MSKTYYILLDVHKDSITVVIAPRTARRSANRRYRRQVYVLNRLVKKLAQPGVELRFAEAEPCTDVITAFERLKSHRSGEPFQI